MSGDGDMLPAFQAVDDYLDELLSDNGSSWSARDMKCASSWPSSMNNYFLCTAAGIAVAMPMSQVADILPASLADGDEVYADDGDTYCRVRVVELAPLLADGLKEPAADMLVVLEGWRWALACRHGEEATFGSCADIDCRAKGGQRPWLGGMCDSGRRVLLDVAALLDMLDRDHRGNPCA